MMNVRRLFSAPRFADADATDSARLLHQIAWGIAGLVTLLMIIIGLTQPMTIEQAMRIVLIVDLAAIVAVALNYRGMTRGGGIVLVGALVFAVTVFAPGGGGIRSTGVQSYFLSVLLAGLLLGERAGWVTALICVTLGLGLVLLEPLGLMPPPRAEYASAVIWILNCLFIGLALLAMRVATARVRRALDKVSAELAERRAAEARLEHALDAGQVGLFEHDPETGTIKADARALALTGQTSRRDGNTRLDDWIAQIHPDDRSPVLRDLEALSDGHPRVPFNFRFVRPDGHERHMEAAAHLVRDPADGTASILGTIMDVTERTRADAERQRLVGDLGERVKELRLLHNVARLLQRSSAVDHLLLTDLVNRLPAAWLHAHDAVARIRCGPLMATSAGWQESAWRLCASFRTSMGPGTVEVAYRSAHPVANEGPFLTEERALIDSIAEMLGSHIERYTVERQRQGLEAQLRQAQKMDALGTLAGGIAHDFNNILTAIGGHAQLAALKTDPETPLGESVREILRAHGRARDVVRRILLFSRQEEAVREVRAVAPIVEEAIALLRSSLGAGVEVAVQAPASLPSVLADATQLHQVVMNLATNAGYAMRDRGGRLTVTLDTVSVEDEASAPAADLAPGEYVRLTVADTGSGIGPEVRERLFEPFFTTKGQAGTGLGLSVVHGIVSDHGGAITVESQVGAGTRFDIYLPAVDAAPRRITPMAAPVRGNGEHIMYVDDEASLCLVVSRTLTHLGYRCTDFQDVDAALQEFRTAPQSYHAVVTDLQMPKMSGLDLVRALRRIRPDVAAAVASGYAAGDLSDPDARTVRWISKPSTLVELSNALHQLVSQADSRSTQTQTAVYPPSTR